MAENQESIDGIIPNLALITDAIQTLFPEGKVICVYELNSKDFTNVQKNFREIDKNHSRFSIDMSGLEHVFINSDFVEPNVVPKVDKKEKTFYKKIKYRLSSWFKSGVSSVE